MKLTSPHLPTLHDPSIVEVSQAIDELVDLRRADPAADECYILIEADDGSGAFIQAIAVGASPHWMIEVCNADEASLRGLREATTRGRAVELLSHFVQGDRSLGNGTEWLDVDLYATRRPVTPTGMALAILIMLGTAVVIWFYSRSA